MKKKHKTVSNNYQARIDGFLKYFASEAPEIRQHLANILPAYNTLVSLNAKSFEEFALQRIARSQGVYRHEQNFEYERILPICIECGSSDNVRKKKDNLYICTSCNKQFTVTHNSIVSGTKCSSLTWMQVLYCMLAFYPIKRTCKECNITPTTFYKIRNKLFYAMQLLMEEVKLYGVIRCDNTFIHTNFKGSDLNDEQYPEDSPFDEISFIPRSSRKRGGSYHMSLKSKNLICIYTAIDEFGHVAVKYTGIGYATATKLQCACPSSKYLLTVPKTDPFPLTFKSRSCYDLYNISSLLVSDEEKAIQKYASQIGIENEYHVFRRAGKQVRLKSGEHDIQQVNALHRRLKEFLYKTHHVASKYLPGYLTFFEFIENTGATQEAIGRLFEILTTPGLGRDATFYDEMFSTPNYLVEWEQDNSALRKLSYNYLLAAYLYHTKISSPSDKGVMTMQEILENTGYSSAGSVRRAYKNIVSSGLIEQVCAKFDSSVKIVETNSVQKAAAQPVPEIFLFFYDEFCEMMQKPRIERTTSTEFIKILNQKYNTTFKRPLLYYYFDRIEEGGYRSVSLSALKEKINTHGQANSTAAQLRIAKKYYDKYIEKVTLLRRNNSPIKKGVIYAEIAAEEGYSADRISRFINIYKNYKKSQDEE